tara:strand:+ start:122 stop:484 length:363 start_codon:yes stop_codon:yes gene_type:complete
MITHQLQALEKAHEAALQRLDDIESRLAAMGIDIMESPVEALTRIDELEARMKQRVAARVAPVADRVEMFTEMNSEEILNEPTAHMSAVVGSYNASQKNNQPGFSDEDVREFVKGIKGGA